MKSATLPSRTTGPSKRRRPTAQQAYYSSLLPSIASPLNALPWELTGFCRWYKGCTGERSDLIPDAHCVDLENGHVYLLEIVETHDIDDEKARAINCACWALDEQGWSVDVVVFYPRQGHTAINHCGLLLNIMAKKFSGQRSPFRRAFTTLTESAARLMVAGAS